MSRSKIQVLICASVPCGTLLACLTLFQRPLNAVMRLGNENRLHFGGYGTAWSCGVFPMPPDANEASCSVEVWLERDVAGASKTILAFYSPENPLQLTVHQYYALLILQCERENKPRRTEMIEIINARSLLSDVPFAIVSGLQETSMYVDGSLSVEELGSSFSPPGPVSRPITHAAPPNGNGSANRQPRLRDNRERHFFERAVWQLGKHYFATARHRSDSDVCGQ